MPSIWNEADRQALDLRLQALQASSQPKWGKMTLKGMLDHLTKGFGLPTGEVKCAPRSGPLRYWPIRDLVIHVMPFPKGVPTAPELLVQSPGDWQQQRKAVRDGLARMGKLSPETPLHDHPAFGKLSRNSWGVLIYRHVDHHLRQFGV